MVKEKLKNCVHCGKELEAKTTRAKFCSPKCRVYWNRDNMKPLEANSASKTESNGKVPPLAKKESLEAPVSNDATSAAANQVANGSFPYIPKSKKSFDLFMAEAKGGVSDIKAFKEELSYSVLNSNQKAMVLSKIKTR